LVVFVHNFIGFLAGFSFLFIKESAISIQGAFYIYGLTCVVGLLYCWKNMPETKNLTLIEINRLFYDEETDQDKVDESPIVAVN